VARGSYLRRMAHRAAPHAPTIVPPRRFGRALSVAPPDEPQPIATSPLPTPAHAPPPATHDLDRPLSVPAVATRDEQVASKVPTTVPIVTGHPVRPRADFVFDAPRRPLSRAPNATNEIPLGTHAHTEPLRTEARLEPGSVAHEPLGPPPPTAQSRGPAPNPLAVALAAAVRWTASDAAPLARSRSAHAASGAHPPVREPIVQSPREPAPLATSSQQTPVALTPARPARAMASPSPNALAVTPRTAATTTERFTGVHIGSVEVEILPPPDPVQPPVASPPAPPSVGTPTQLSRGLTSSIGLRQS
jgi:hypothetical protein